MSEDGMDLKTFIQSTLVQIVQGTSAAIEEISTMGSDAKINPYVSHGLHSDAKDVEFDVAITVTDAKSGSGGAGIKVAAFQIGAQGEKKIESQAVSRVKFSIPVAVPGKATEQYRNSSQHYARTEHDDDF